MLILKSGLRLFYRRRLESIAIILLIMITVSLYISLHLDKDNFTRYIYNSMTETLGHISLFGRFDEDAVKLLEGLEGVDHVSAYYYWIGYTYRDIEVDGREYRVKYDASLVDSSIIKNDREIHIVIKDGRLPKNSGEALLYKAVYEESPRERGAEIKLGDKVTIYSYGVDHVLRKYNFTIVGYAIGLAEFGYSDYTLFVNRTIISKLTNGSYSWIAIYSKSLNDRDIEDLGDQAIRVLRDHGYHIAGSWLNKPGENYIKTIFESIMAYFTTPIILSIVLIAIVSIASGVSLVERNTRINGVLKAIGSSKLHLFIIYSIPWFIRGSIGVLLSAILSPLIAEKLLYLFGSNISEILDYLIKAYGFQTDPYSLIYCSTISLAIIMAGSLIPGIIASKIRTVEAINFTGLKPRRTLGLDGGARLRIATRDLLSRPWKLLTLFVTILIILSLMTAVSANIDSMYREIDEYFLDQPDIILYVEPVSYVSASPLYKVYDIIRNNPDIESITYTVYHTIINGLRQHELMAVYSIVNGSGTNIWSLVKGRYPSSSGEIAITKTISVLLGKDLDDTIYIDDEYGVPHKFRVVGIINAYSYNGLIAVIALKDFAEMTRSNVRDVLAGYSAEVYIRVKKGVDPEELGWMLKEDIESKPYYKVRLYIPRNTSGNIGLIAGILYSILSVVYLVGVIGLSAIFIIDFAGRLREVGVLRAIGFTNSDLLIVSFIEIVFATILSIPATYLLGYILAETLNRATILAKGYIDLDYSTKYMFATNNMLVLFIAYMLSLATIYLYLRRLKTSELLRVE